MQLFDKTVNLILEESNPKPKYEVITSKNYTKAYMEEKRRNRGWLMDIVPFKDEAIGPAYNHLGMFRVYKQIDADGGEAAQIRRYWKKAIIVTGRTILDALDLSEEEIKEYELVDSFESEYIVNDMSDLAEVLPASHMEYWLETWESDDVRDTFSDLFTEI